MNGFTHPNNGAGAGVELAISPISSCTKEPCGFEYLKYLSPSRRIFLLLTPIKN